MTTTTIPLKDSMLALALWGVRTYKRTSQCCCLCKLANQSTLALGNRNVHVSLPSATSDYVPDNNYQSTKLRIVGWDGSTSLIKGYQFTPFLQTELNCHGEAVSKGWRWLFSYFYIVAAVVKKTDLLTKLKIQPRDLRFSTASSLYVRASNIILRLQVSPFDITFCSI